MAIKKENKIIYLVCSKCNNRNYSFSKKRKTQAGGSSPHLELSKYCKFCHQHTLHKESK